MALLSPPSPTIDPIRPDRFSSVDDRRFRHGVDLRLSERVTIGQLLVHCVLRWVVVFVLAGVVTSPLLLLAWRAIKQGTSPVFFLVVSTPICILAAFASLMIPVRIGTGEFGLLLDDRAPFAPNVHQGMISALRRRSIPVDKVEIRPVAAGGGSEVRNYIYLRRSKQEIWITVAPSGTDLWVAWTGWIVQRPILMPWIIVRQLVTTVAFKGSSLHESLRLNDAKATRAAVHHATLEAIEGAGIESVGLDGSHGAGAPANVGQPVQPTPVASGPASPGLDGWWRG